MKYELELHEDNETLDRIKELFDNLYNILLIQNKDSRDAVEGGAVVHYNIMITVEEKWV
jgi:hypothetical protein